MSGFTGHLPGSREYRRLIVGLFFAGVATFAQLYSPQAVLPSIARSYGVDPSTAALAVSAATAGLAAAVVPWSRLADRIGRVQAMSIGVVAAAVLGIVTPFAPGIGGFFAVRLLEGAALGAVPAIALAYLSEEVDAAHAARAAGSYVAGNSIGGLAGRLVAGPFGDLGLWRFGLLTDAVLCAAAAVLFVWLAPRSRGFVPTRLGGERGPGVVPRLIANLRSPAQLALYAQALLLMGGFVAVYNYLGFHLAAPPYLLPQWLVSLLFLAYLSGTIASPRAGALASRVGRFPVLLGASAGMAAGALLTAVPWLPLALVGLLLFTGSFFAAHAVASGWAPAIADPAARAQSSSLYYLAYYAGSSLFGWALGLVFAGAGWLWLVVTVTAMVVLAAGIAASALRGHDPRPVALR